METQQFLSRINFNPQINQNKTKQYFLGAMRADTERCYAVTLSFTSAQAQKSNVFLSLLINQWKKICYFMSDT